MQRMTSSRVLLGALVFAVLGTSSATSAVKSSGQAQALPQSGRLFAFGGRSPQQQQSVSGRKLDATLAGISRHANLARATDALAQLHAVNPAARFMQATPGGTAYVAVDVVTRGDPQQLKAALLALGLKRPAVFLNDVGGWLPVSAIDAAAARTEVHSMRAALSRRRAGAVTSQGDFAIGASAVRSAKSWNDGTGVTVGILSDSFDCYSVYASTGVPASGNQGYASNGFTADAATDKSTGDLPTSVNVLSEAPCSDYGAPTFLPDSDEGRAMLQIVHDVAPGANLAFHTAINSEADFASGITALAAAGAKVIADDIGYFDEPFFQDGLIAQAVNQVESQGVAYFSAAGNDGASGYDNLNPKFVSAPGNPNVPAGELALNFDTSGATTTTSLSVTLNFGLAAGEFVPIVVEWDQPYVTGTTGLPMSPGATSHIDLCVSGAGALDVFNPDTGAAETCTGPNATGSDPVQVLIIGNPANGPNSSPSNQQITITVGLAGGTPAPTRIKLGVFDDFGGQIATIKSFATNGATIQGHAGAAGALTIGAAFFPQTPHCGTSPAVLESYSSIGGDPILFDIHGQSQAPVVRQKPDVVGPDGVNNTFLGFQLVAGQPPEDTSTVAECANVASLPNFFGTSAATPHAAAVAALLLQGNPQLSPTAIYTALRTSAAKMTAGSPPDFLSGYGFIDAQGALTQIPDPAAPTINTYDLNPTTINLGQSATLTWAAQNVTGCTASDAWSGGKAASGSQMFTPTTAGSFTYTLTCTNLTGEAIAQQTLTVVQPSGGGGGGGALDLFALLTLAGVAGARVARARARG
jgi:hypothetical protein